MMKWFKYFKLWIKYRKHPCYIGNGEFDHTLVEEWDEQGAGIYTATYCIVFCEICGATCDEDVDVPEYLDH